MAPDSSIATFDDPDAFAAAVHHARVRIIPDRPGRFRARLTLVRLDGVSLAMASEFLPRVYTSETSPDRLYFRLKHPDEPASLVGGQVEPAGSVRVRFAGRYVVERTPGPAVVRSMSIPVADLARRAEALLGGQPEVLRAAPERLYPLPADFARLAALQRDVFRLAAEQPEVLAHPAAAAALDADLGEAILALLAGAAPRHDTTAQRRGHAIMKLVQGRIEADPARAFTLAELCNTGGCSAKTLEVLFRDRVGMTPTRYLRLRRLWLARGALLSADPRTATVSKIALACGFWELGRFAVAYRAQFGESPSETLRARQGRRQDRIDAAAARVDLSGDGAGRIFGSRLPA